MTPRVGRDLPRGFTLIELIVVLAIVMVAVALVLPSIDRGAQGARLRSEAGRIAALVREARQQAVNHRQSTRVTLDRARNTVAVTTADADRAARELTLPPGLRLSVDTGGETVAFSARGLTRDTRWILEAPGGRRLVISVHGVTGRVVVTRDETAG